MEVERVEKMRDVLEEPTNRTMDKSILDRAKDSCAADQ